ncbi:MAG: tetratricopeptide repeat protein [Phormidesmis sp.]
MIAIQPKSRQILGTNQQAYQALKASMSLNLRRQLLIAVCDNVVLQNQLATQLEHDLAGQTWSMPSFDTDTPKSTSLALERLIFDPEDAHLPRQVAHWVKEATVEGLAEGLVEESLPQVQVLGIEQMTRQPAIVQNHFLRSLEQMEVLLPRLNTSLLVWVPWPWLRTIQTSSPTFWKWRNAVFEFVSDPTPILPPSESFPEAADTNALNADRFAEEAHLRSNSSASSDSMSDSMSANTMSADTILVNNGHSPTHRERPSSIHSYPTITIPAVVSLYGETDESETDDDDQPVVETIATWEPPDVAAVPAQMHTAEPAIELEDHDPTAGYLSELAAQKAEAQEVEDQEAEAQAIAEQIERQALERQASERQEGSAQSSQAQSSQAQRSEERSQFAQSPFPEPSSEPFPEPSSESSSSEPSSSEPSSESTFSLDSTFSSENTFSLDSSFLNTVPSRSAVDDYFEVGHSYRQRIEAGERGLDLIEPAIAAYEGGLRSLTGPHPDWASGLNDLGTLYWLKAQQLSDQQQVVDCMDHSVYLYSEALTKIDPTIEPNMAYQLHSNLGAVHSMLAMHSAPVFHFQQAAESYLNALSLCALATDPEEFSTLQNSLGSVYWKLSHYEQVSAKIELTLRQAITAYEQALLGYSPAQRPLDYAAVQNNLGITYWSLSKHTTSVSALKNAIAAYRDALNYRTPETAPATCAITYNNLALAYWDLSKDESVDREHKLRYQRNAVTAFEAALQTAQSVGSLNQLERAAIYHCLGDVHAQMVESAPSLTEVAESLQKSLYSYVQAIDGMPSESPVFEARLLAIIANLRSHQEHLGLASQQQALNRVPITLISRVMQAL